LRKLYIGTWIASWPPLSPHATSFGTQIYSRCSSEGRIASIWTHGEFLCFVAVEPGSITIREVGFTSKYALAEIESLPAPDGNRHSRKLLFLPTRSRLAFILQDAVLIWDALDSKFFPNFVARIRSMGVSFTSGSGRSLLLATYLTKNVYLESIKIQWKFFILILETEPPPPEMKNQPSCPNIRKFSCARNRPNHLPLQHSGSTCEVD